MKRCAATGKVRHRTKEAAIITAKRVKNCAMNVFACSKCKGWHLGRSNSPFRRAQRIDQILDRHARELAARLAASGHISNGGTEDARA